MFPAPTSEPSDSLDNLGKPTIADDIFGFFTVTLTLFIALISLLCILCHYIIKFLQFHNERKRMIQDSHECENRRYERSQQYPRIASRNNNIFLLDNPQWRSYPARSGSATMLDTAVTVPPIAYVGDSGRDQDHFNVGTYAHTGDGQLNEGVPNDAVPAYTRNLCAGEMAMLVGYNGRSPLAGRVESVDRYLQVTLEWEDAPEYAEMDPAPYVEERPPLYENVAGGEETEGPETEEMEGVEEEEKPKNEAEQSCESS